MSNPKSDIRKEHTPTQSPYPLSVPAESPIGIDISKPQPCYGSNSPDGFAYKRKSLEEHGGCEKRRRGVHLQLLSDVQNADVKLFLDASNRFEPEYNYNGGNFGEDQNRNEIGKRQAEDTERQDLDNEKIGDGAAESGERERHTLFVDDASLENVDGPLPHQTPRDAASPISARAGSQPPPARSRFPVKRTLEDRRLIFVLNGSPWHHYETRCHVKYDASFGVIISEFMLTSLMNLCWAPVYPNEPQPSSILHQLSYANVFVDFAGHVKICDVEHCTRSGDVTKLSDLFSRITMRLMDKEKSTAAAVGLTKLGD
ncbi:hypothetical protein O1611_g6654 [Lasiodiplodia mahajangana]|uniref:Uncharacterized protein n=1 Tax=Lasiodiplodia mahajangana TaxID=1108764 RepID=A0ACC2JI10_9PEZI|nr:hypothetical protein O1611_g6654 [Lasiodiplodia mahajangana]